jgi:hypothetical protein
LSTSNFLASLDIKHNKIPETFSYNHQELQSVYFNDWVSHEQEQDGSSSLYWWHAEEAINSKTVRLIESLLIIVDFDVMERSDDDKGGGKEVGSRRIDGIVIRMNRD